MSRSFHFQKKQTLNCQRLSTFLINNHNQLDHSLFLSSSLNNQQQASSYHHYTCCSLQQQQQQQASPSDSKSTESTTTTTTENIINKEQEQSTTAEHTQDDDAAAVNTISTAEENLETIHDIDQIFKHHYTRAVFEKGVGKTHPELNTLWNDFLDDRSVNTYLHFRAEYEMSEFFDPRRSDVEGVRELLAAQEYERVLNDDQVLLQNIICPSMYKLRAFAHQQVGNELLAIEDMDMMSMLIVCIEGTGDGSQERPFLVLYPADQKEMLKTRGLTAVSSKIQTVGEGESTRYLEEVHCNEGSYLWFDVTSYHKKPKPRVEVKEEAVESTETSTENK